MTPRPPGTPFDVASALRNVRGRGPVLILMHDNPDPDSMAAAEAMRALLVSRAEVTVTVARGGIVGRPENRAMVVVLGLDHVSVDAVDLGAFATFVLVDTQPETGNNSLPPGHRIDIVVDHHPMRPQSARAPWCDIRDDYGASSTIAYDYLKQAGVAISEDLATALFYAIKSETRDLGREASDHEYEAYAELLRLANLEKLHAIAAPKVSGAHFAALDRALRAATLRGPLVAANLGELDYPDLVAEIADLLLPYDKAHWILCVGQHRGVVFLSIRTDCRDANAGELIKKVVAGRGAAGGHGMVAGGRLHAPARSEPALALAYHTLVEAMAGVLGLANEKPVPLLGAPA